ncbi:hypothetical protein [Helicobacter sp. T3_23-1056]
MSLFVIKKAEKFCHCHAHFAGGFCVNPRGNPPSDRHCEQNTRLAWQSITKNYKKALFGIFLIVDCHALRCNARNDGIENSLNNASICHT